MLKYKKTVGDVDLYGSYLFEDSEYLPGNGLRYKRKGGGSVGADYHIMKDLTWGTAWNYTRAEMRDPSSSDSKTYDQNIVGTALSWTRITGLSPLAAAGIRTSSLPKKPMSIITSPATPGGLNILRAINSRSINMPLNLFSRTLWATVWNM